MSLVGVNLKPKVHQGGGILGKVIGGAIGAIGAAAAPLTGGASLAAALPAAGAGFGIGSTVGGLAGEAIDPTKQTGDVSVPSIARTVMEQNPEVQLQQLKDAKDAVGQVPGMPGEERDMLLGHFNLAEEQARKAAAIKPGGGYVDSRFRNWS